jgi:hypothetical protein
MRRAPILGMCFPERNPPELVRRDRGAIQGKRQDPIVHDLQQNISISGLERESELVPGRAGCCRGVPGHTSLHGARTRIVSCAAVVQQQADIMTGGDTTWYHRCMAMTLRLSEEQTEALRRKAEVEHRSMQQVAVSAIDAYVSQFTPARRQAVPVSELLEMFSDLPPMSVQEFRADQDRYADGDAYFDAYEHGRGHGGED